MNDVSVKNFCIWARNELRDQVRQRLIEWQISEDAELDLAVVGARPLSTNERGQRRELMTLVKDLGEEGLVERAAYTWFNRFMAIRYMEVNGFLPSGARFLSDAEGEFRPQVIADASSTGIEGIDEQTVFELIQNADDEELFRYLFLAQCNELAACMPDVFEPIGSAMELLLPKGLLRQGSVIERMVTDIPEDAWRESVQIVGWMYQYYNAERKDEVFASFKKGKKADAASLAPATQLFTPDWIVRYLVENSLGRLWMRSHPDSKLVDQMAYYIPDEPSVISAETPICHFERAEAPTCHFERSEAESRNLSLTPESVTLVDPACGSGHILVYAFDLLAAIYEEAGYVPREIPQLILQKNLTGIEIDPRAGAMASFMLTMKGCERDRRFLARKVYPNITVLAPVRMEEEELALVPDLADRAKLLDAMAHADECGSLFKPEAQDMDAIDEALGRLRESDDLFADRARDKLERMRANCEPLARAYDVVVANPPYMGSSNMGRWLADWTKKAYPDSKRDLCTCFIERGFTLADAEGYSAMITMQSWMFLSNAEALRSKLLKSFSIETMAHLGARAFDSIGGEVVSTTATVFRRGASGDVGSYVRLVDYGSEAEKQAALKGAIADPDCGWFYRRDVSSFSAIPGTPIAYWASDAMIRAFEEGEQLNKIGIPRQGLATGENARFVRQWWEVSSSNSKYDCMSIEDSIKSDCRWFPYNKGGDYRKWYGNNESIVNWEDDGREIRGFVDSTGKLLSRPQNTSCYFQPSITWSKISSGSIAFRYKPQGHIFDVAGTSIFADGDSLAYLQGACNTSVMLGIATMLSPTLNFEVGQIATYPIIESEECEPKVLALVQEERDLSKADWDSSETSWDFQCHPMA